MYGALKGGAQRRPRPCGRTQNHRCGGAKNVNRTKARRDRARDRREHNCSSTARARRRAPRCGFTLETIQFFDGFGYPFEVIDVLENMPKREALAEMTDWPTLPKVFINGNVLRRYRHPRPDGAERRAAERACKKPSAAPPPSTKQTIQPCASAFTTIISPEELHEQLGDRELVIFDCRHSLADFTLGRRLYDEAHVPGAFFADVEDDLAGRKPAANGRHPLPDPETFARFLRACGRRRRDANRRLRCRRRHVRGAFLVSRALDRSRCGRRPRRRIRRVASARAIPSRRRPLQPGAKATLTLRLRPEIVVDAEYVLAHLNDPAMQLLDARAEERYCGRERNRSIRSPGTFPARSNRWFKENFNAGRHVQIARRPARRVRTRRSGSATRRASMRLGRFVGSERTRDASTPASKARASTAARGASGSPIRRAPSRRPEISD